jgi:hypothetical protein
MPAAAVPIGGAGGPDLVNMLMQAVSGVSGKAAKTQPQSSKRLKMCLAGPNVYHRVRFEHRPRLLLK